MVYKHLTAEERGKIEAYLDEGLRPAEIARRLDRHRSTITREIQRFCCKVSKRSLVFQDDSYLSRDS